MILVDTGALVAAAITNQPEHRECVDLFTSLRLAGRTMIVPPTVVAETGFLLEKNGGVRAESAFIRALARRDFVGGQFDDEDYERIAELVDQYADLPLGTTDASIIALAERLGLREVATLDRRHFTVVRPRHIDAFTLLPEIRPERPAGR
ncbi:hypothetical protein BJY21_002512 [Kineosphaera limosa]|uniref:Ribonuclease VapC n=1 Tax=Kineosphaera limosa NBRC 100340 TaxID=1184609 RepID=K6W8H5_9MICO|nr:PIN domain-containing protein [Kineosphaera limosa]NYE01328.1 hypothetical protein [Kineosphaera limosa]GAB95500.1 hypothetical protein KILIM_021_00400 [Kineosphaera limosa NBRC 100340]